MEETTRNQSKRKKVIPTLKPCLKVALYSFFKKWKFTIYILILIIICLKTKSTFVCKTTSKEFEFVPRSYTIAVAMATMTFQDGGYFSFKEI